MLLFIALCLINCNCSNKQAAGIEQMTRTADSIRIFALQNMHSITLLKGLCSQGGRLSGSESSLQAIRWIKGQMESMGFDSVWLQPVRVPRWERGKIETATVHSASRKIKQNLSIAALGGSIGTLGLKARIVEINSFDDLKARGAEVKGRIVFFNVKFDNTELDPYVSYGKIASYRARGAMEAAKYGAAAVIVRSITSLNDNTPHVGSMRYDDNGKKIPAVSIGYQDADMLHNLLILDASAQISLKLSCKTLDSALSYNVIGDLRGYERPEEIILTGGHIDAWDKGDGAHDDGAGCVQAIESVILFKRLGIRPKRTLRTVLFINEENGARGAYAYSGWSDSTKQKHIAAIESDRGGFAPRGFYLNNDSLTINQFANYLPVLERCGILFIRKGGAGVDVDGLKNCPLLFGYVPDNARYFDVHHSANDVTGSVNPRELELGSAAIAALIFVLDNR